MASISRTQTIFPCLWFNKNATEAVKFYTSVFKDGKQLDISYYGKNAPLPEGTVLTISFRIAGQEFMALNGGPEFQFSEAISLVVRCRSQKEIDYYWNRLSRGGSKSVCGWLTDKYGLSWQVVPAQLNTWISGRNKEKSSQVMQAVMKMKKPNIRILEKAYRTGAK